MKKNELVQFLLSRCLAKELITKAEVLNSVLKDYQDHFLVVFGQASEYLQLVFGLEVKEVDPSEHTYILVPSLGLILSEMLSDGQRYAQGRPPGGDPVPDRCGGRPCT